MSFPINIKGTAVPEGVRVLEPSAIQEALPGETITLPPGHTAEVREGTASVTDQTITFSTPGAVRLLVTGPGGARRDLEVLVFESGIGAHVAVEPSDLGNPRQIRNILRSYANGGPDRSGLWANMSPMSWRPWGGR